ncbi:hypothetical protein SS50377_26205 [Spironucleus salmonicida]|uniref:Uncharacterized protein n=1 Tax=Spironucleus salmonicida TaxID=348837 RepID=V6LGL8_9EUKA|nr:hypothetical protein SS50377_26205 [Spironucleus salmonicida]|eukprot:EST42846.1 Hypothetical protein SS50377_17532 [Spironucleus salmonicida]
MKNHYFRAATDYHDAAQAIVAQFSSPEDPRIVTMPSLCGKDSRCGAAHAAVMLRPDLEDLIVQEFNVEAGSANCIEILRLKKLTCVECVQLVGQFLDDFLVDEKKIAQDIWWKEMKE